MITPIAIRRFSVFLIVLSTLSAAARLRAQEDPITGHIRVEPKEAAAADDARPRPLIVEVAGAAPGDPDWQAAYRQAPGVELSAAARTTLEVARHPRLDRASQVQQIKDGGEATRGLVRSLDVGRHDLLKWMHARAFVLANAQLEGEGRSPLGRVLSVNSGGTGDYLRDQDITTFAGDPSTERIYFESLVAAAREIGLDAVRKPAGSIDFPQIEVTLFPGGNDLPDSRFATDIGEFQLDYIRGMGRQLSDVEAYVGGGADIEVKGRRRPGQVHAQEFRADGRGGVGYRAEIPGNRRETHALFSIEPRDRPEAWQRAAHIYNDLLQGYRHSLHGDDPTKGPLKYAGRAIDQLTAIRGKKPWAELHAEERSELLQSLFPGQKVGDALLQRLGAVLDVSTAVVRDKRLPADARPATDEKIALIFLKKAVAASAGEMARQAVDPPRFDVSWLEPAERARWDAMNPAERHEEALRRDRAYRENFSNESYENLVVMMTMMRRIDVEEAKLGRAFHGEAAIRQMIDVADPRLRSMLEDASDYARLMMEIETAPDARKREGIRAELVDARTVLGGHIDEEAPGRRLIDEMERKGARAFVADDMAGRRALPAAAAEVKERFAEHLREAFPATADEYHAFRARLGAIGVKGYVAEKIQAEFFQLDTIADGLTLIEMYQHGAGAADYGRFVAVNLLSRIHWSFGHLYQASQTRTVEDVELLGKNLVFATLSRVVPWAATAKIVFDVGRGLVTVTVGYSIDVVNADLVDALYTGEAGRANEKAAGTAGGRIRDSGFAILVPDEVIRVKDEKSGEEKLAIDRPAVYRRFFKAWTGEEPEALPDFGTRRGELAQAHDELVRLLERQAEEKERGWVSNAKRKPVTKALDEAEVEKAILTLQKIFLVKARAEADRVASEAGVRSYKSLFDSEDVITKGLAERFAADLLMGFLTEWETRNTARLLAMRDVERSAMQLDCAAYARALRENRHQGIVAGLAPEGVEPPSFELLVDLRGLRVDGGDVFDGSEPVRIVAQVLGRGEVGERPGNLVIKVDVEGSTIEQKAGKDPEILEAGDIVRSRRIVRVLADEGRGAELVRKSVEFLVRMPEATKKDPAELLVRHHVERNSRGVETDSFDYIERSPNMPVEWPREDGYVFHGRRDVLRYGTARESIEYRFGTRHGMHEICDGQGRWVIHETYVDGLLEGTRIHRDPDSQARHEGDYRGGVMVEERTYHENGKLARRLGYDREDDPDPERWHCRGKVEAYWSNGQPHFVGSYDVVGREAGSIRERGGVEGETVPGRQGVWQWFHMNGAKARRASFRDGLLEGPYESWDEQGRSLEVGEHAQGLRTGSWRMRLANEEGFVTGAFLEDRRHGRWEYVNAEGRPSRWEVYDRGSRESSGFYEEE